MNNSSLHAHGMVLFAAAAGCWSLPAKSASVTQNPYTDRSGIVCIDNQVADIYRKAGGPRLDFSAVPPGSPLESASDVWPLRDPESDLKAGRPPLLPVLLPLNGDLPAARVARAEAAPAAQAPEARGFLAGCCGAVLLFVSSPAKRRRRHVSPSCPWRAA